MKNLHIFALILSFAVPGLANADAVEKVNFEVSTEFDHADYGNSIGLSGSVRTPLTKNTGMSVFASTWKFNAKENYADSTSRFISAGLFVRDPKIGALYASYGHQNSKHDLGFTTRSNSYDSFNLSGSYYLNNFTVALTRHRLNRDEGESSNRSALGLHYYFNDNLSFGLSASGMDGKDRYSASFEYQPKYFKQSVSLRAGYHDFDWDQSISLSLSYFFDTRVSLMKRARNY